MNWVKARAECAVRSMFQALRERVEADVVEFNGHDTGGQCVFIDESPRHFIVSLQPPGRGAVNFRGNGHCIAVECADDADTRRLVVDDRPLELWELSKKALSPLFFG